MQDLFTLVDRERVLVLRYWQLVSKPTETLNRVCRFLGIAEDRIGQVPADNSRPFVGPGLRTTVIGQAIRSGAALGQHLPPTFWRQASKPLVAALQFRGSRHRPALPPGSGLSCSGTSRRDIALLEEVLGESFQDWRSTTGRGAYAAVLRESGDGGHQVVGAVGTGHGLEVVAGATVGQPDCADVAERTVALR